MDIFKEYDKIVGKSIEGMLMVVKDDPAIAISRLNPKDRDHLYLFNIGVISSELTNKPLIINTNLFNFIRLKLAFPKFKFKWGLGMVSNIDAPSFIDMLYGLQFKVGFISLWEIYNAYYNPVMKGE